MKRRFKALYTHQKTKKKKIWQDGYLALSLDEKRGILQSEDRKEISSLYLKKNEVVECGSDLESAQYLIQVEEELSQETQSQEPTVSSQVPPKTPLAPRPPVAVNKPKVASPKNECGSQPFKRKFSIPRRSQPITNPDIAPAANDQKEKSTSSIWNEIKPLQPSTEENEDLLPAKYDVKNTAKEFRGTQDLLNLLDGNNDKIQDTFKLSVEPSALSSTYHKANSLKSAKMLIRPKWNEFTLEKSVNSEILLDKLKKGLFFPTKSDRDDNLNVIPEERSTVPVSFESVKEYTNAWSGVLHERLNIAVWKVCSNYHSLMENADISNFVSKQPNVSYFNCNKNHREGKNFDFPNSESKGTKEITQEEIMSMEPPQCHHGATCKVACVRKPGPNLGRYFFTCPKGKKGKCRFFKWADEAPPKSKIPDCPPAANTTVKINNARALTSYLNRNKVNLFIDCEIYRNSGRPISNPSTPTDDLSTKTQVQRIAEDLENGKRYTILKLSRQDQSLGSTKDDLLLLSNDLKFESDSILVRVLSNSQSAAGTLGVQPISARLPHEWLQGATVHALHLGKAWFEFSCLRALRNQLDDLPILPYLLGEAAISKKKSAKVFSLSQAPDCTQEVQKCRQPRVATFTKSFAEAFELVGRLSAELDLDDEQGIVLSNAAEMLLDKKSTVPPLLLIDGVPGSGKTLTLAAVIMLISHLLSSTNQSAASDAERDPIGPSKTKAPKKNWKILVVAESDASVDNLLLQLLDFGFERLTRVGDLDHVDKRLLPYSAHCRGGSEGHAKKLKRMLQKCEKSDPERNYIERSLQESLSGSTKRLLRSLVVGITCKESLGPYIGYYKFPVVLLDDASSACEPLTLLPLKRFACEKLIIAGDSKMADTSGRRRSRLSLFQRLLDCGYESSNLTSNYRCHPNVVALLNNPHYDDTVKVAADIQDGGPLVKGLPNVCFCDLLGKEETSGSGDYKNDDEARFVADVIKLLLSQGVPGSCVVVMTNYDAQIGAIKSAMQEIEFYDLSDVNCVRVDRLRRFQGAETKVVVISCVRNSCDNQDKKSDVIRMLTRARNHVIVVASLRHLATNPVWKQTIEFCRQQHTSQVTSSFHFRKLFQSRMNAFLAETLTDEVPLRAEPCDVTDDDVTSSQVSEDSDDDEKFFEILKRQSASVKTEASSDKIRTLRPKRARLLELDDVTSDDDTGLSDHASCDDVTTDGPSDDDEARDSKRTKLDENTSPGCGVIATASDFVDDVIERIDDVANCKGATDDHVSLESETVVLSTRSTDMSNIPDSNNYVEKYDKTTDDVMNSTFDSETHDVTDRPAANYSVPRLPEGLSKMIKNAMSNDVMESDGNDNAHSAVTSFPDVIDASTNGDRPDAVANGNQLFRVDDCSSHFVLALDDVISDSD